MSCVLSIIIVTYNSEQDIEKCLSSLFQQSSLSKGEVVVVDNYSTDGTVAILKHFQKKFSQKLISFELIHNPVNIGFTRAVNQALEKVSGRFVLLLNPDTQPEQNSIDLLVQYLSNHPQVGAVAPQLLFPDGEVQPSCRRFPRYRYIWFEVLGLSRLFPGSSLFNGWKMGDFDHRHTASVDQPQGACLLVRRELLQQIGLLDERFRMFFSDVDLCRRIVGLGREIHFFPEAKVIHSLGRSVFAHRASMIWQSHLDFANYFLKWYRSPLQRVSNILGLPFLFLVGCVRWLLVQTRTLLRFYRNPRRK